jgi:hypothetical protein
MSKRSSDSSSPFGSSIKPEQHDGSEAGQDPMKTDKEVWDVGDGILGTRGDNSSPPETTTERVPRTSEIGRTGRRE